MRKPVTVGAFRLGTAQLSNFLGVRFWHLEPG